MSTMDPAISSAWMRAVHLATTTPELGEALAGVLAEAVAATGAAAGAVLEGREGTVRATWACAEAELAPLLADDGPVRPPLQRVEDWVDGGVVVSRGDAPRPWSGPTETLVLASLRSRGLATGALLLLYPAGTPPASGVPELAGAFAGLAGLVLENDRLYEEARRALQARDHFLTALNHELRTPAHQLLLSADLLRADSAPLPAHVERGLRDAESSVNQLVAVLRRVLDLGHIGGHAAPEHRDILSPRDAVADLLRRVEPVAQRKNLSLSLFVPRNLPPLQTDGARFSRILLHLFSNAIKYTTQGGVEVRLERTQRVLFRNRHEPVLAIHVKDTGRGIPTHELERIFEPFAQVDEGSRSNSSTRGLGLGLPLARQLARSLGGDILIDSAAGRGTVATLVLPYQAPTA